MEFYAYSMLLILPLILYMSYHLTRTLAEKKPTTHGLKAHPLLGHLPAFVKNSHRFLDWSTELIAGSPEMRIGLWIPGMRSGIVTGNPADVEHILRTNFANYPKGQHAIGMLEDFLGHGLFNSDGEQWLWQRKNASYEFSKRSLRKFVVDVVQAEVANRLLPLLRRAAGDGVGGDAVVLDLQDVLQRFGFDTICMVAFGHDPRCLADGGVLEEAKSEFMRNFGEALDLVIGRFMDPIEVSWKIKKWLNIGTERRLKKAIADVHAFAMDIVRARRQSASVKDRDDVLSRFVASDEYSDEVLRDIVLSFLVAGRETTSSGLTWFFWLLSSRPDVVARIADEVRAVRKATGTRPGEPFGFDALREMHYLHAALTESMRLYPPVPTDPQSCAADDTLPDGTFVRAGWFVNYSAYAMGRLAAIWGEDCMEYRPERWLGDDGAFQPASPFRFTVFHAGPRMCLGKEMAYVQMKSIVANVIEELVVDVVKEVAGGGVPEHVFSISLRMKGGLPVKIRRKGHMRGTVRPSIQAAAPGPRWLRLAATLRPISPATAAVRYPLFPLACGHQVSAVTMAKEVDRFVELVVVRHGETSWNSSRIVQGQMDPELNEIGKQQAVVVARRLARKARPAAIYSSDLKRAAETVKIIAKVCDVSNLVLIEALRERHMGYLPGLTWDDAMNKSPGVFKGFANFEVKNGLDFDGRNHEFPDGGESLNQLSERCISYLNKVAQNHIGERVIVVGHGAAILELYRHTDPPNSSIRRKIPNTSLNIFRISDVTGRWILERCGDVGHLSENGFLENAFGGQERLCCFKARSLAALLPSPLSDAHLAAAVSSLPDPDLAVALLSWSQSPDHHVALQDPTPLAHSTLLRLLARSRRFDAVDDTLHSMSLAGAAPTRACLGALVAAYADAGMLGKATEMCERVREQYGSLLEVTHCNHLLKLLVEQRRWDDGRKLYDEMLGKDSGADNYSTCVLVRGLCLERRVEEGLKLIEARWGAGCIPHVVFYNVLIDGYCRRGDMGRGLLLLGEMETKGFLPTLVTYGSLINWLGKKGDLEKIGSLFLEMRKRGFSPNVQIYNSVIDALCNCRSATQAMVILKQMFASGCDPDIITFNTLMTGLCHEGHVRKAEHFLREAIRRELNPNQLSYTPLIHGFCMRGELMVASDLLVEMMGRGHTPDVVTFGALIHGLVVAGKVSEALIVREKMTERQVFPDVNIYNVLISGLCKKRMLPAAKNILEEMLEKNVQPDEFVYATLIDGFIRSENLGDARKIFEFMEHKGVCPDIVSCNAMIKGYCQFGMMSEAILCMSNMRKQLEVERSGTFIVPSNWRSGINMTKSPAEISTQSVSNGHSTTVDAIVTLQARLFGRMRRCKSDCNVA
ncbi:hypothetical protein OsI_37392 [Oryza sativa Indica Group]|uniref:Uncharacterized protein n=1 Tax=Oryza sativa subsp. indica TaxID=39946 RepID=B8BLY1_ORYSI|nr:hypothetical protein OsI_37392 [Oryza sativa Indica Group]